MTQAELQEAMSTPSVRKRLEYVNDIEVWLSKLKQEDPTIVTKLLEMVAITTHDVDTMEAMDEYQNRKVFCAAQKSLRLLHTHIMMRLKMVEVDESKIDHENLIEIEKNYLIFMPSQRQNWSKDSARERFHLLKKLYGKVMESRPRSDASTLTATQITIWCLLGDPFLEHDKDKGVSREHKRFDISNYLHGDERRLWNTWTYKFAVGVLIRMAKLVSAVFINPVNLMGTMIPASSFISNTLMNREENK